MHPKAQKEGPINATLHNKGFAHWLGAICHAQSLYVWVPAHWAPCICTVVTNRTTEFDRKRDHEAFFFCCIAELAIKPCRSSRSKLRGEFGIPKHLQNRKQKHKKATNTPNPTHNTKQKQHGKCLEGETRGEKRVKRPKRPNALMCRTPGGSIRYTSIVLFIRDDVDIP